MAIVNTMPMPEKIARATKDGVTSVVCQPGGRPIAKSNDTTECTESTSGVANAARKRYARVKCRHSRSELRQPSESDDRIALRTGFFSRSRSTPMSGINPMYRKVLEIVRYVRIANTSQTSGLLGFGQMSRQFGYGMRKKNFQGRPR